MPQTDELVKDQTTTEQGDHDVFSHYVSKNKLLESQVTGMAVRALCGKFWLPTRDATKFPVCPACKKIYETLKES